MRDYYSILGIAPDATDADIKAAFRRLSHRFHPDKNGGGRYFEEKFRAIMEAYTVLSDQVRRAAYDEQLRQYRTLGRSSAGPRRTEETLAGQFAAELRRREAELRQVYTRGGMPENGGAATGACGLGEREEMQRPDLVKRWLAAGLAVAIMILAAMLLIKKQPADAKPAPQKTPSNTTRQQ